MIHLATSDLLRFLASYGDFAVLFFVAIESTGIPFPGETMLLVAAIFAGTTHRLFIPLVILAAESFAILGDNLGFWVGREGGFRLLRRYGRYIRLDERKLKLGLYLFRRHGGKVVFFGRFIAVLRAWAAFLAGTNRMRWPAFLLFNALGGIVWATVYGLGGYFLAACRREAVVCTRKILQFVQRICQGEESHTPTELPNVCHRPNRVPDSQCRLLKVRPHLVKVVREEERRGAYSSK